MAKLWDKGYSIDEGVERYTVGQDYSLDQELVQADVAGSIAHASMLAKIGVLKQDELRKLKAGLLQILDLDKSDQFIVKPEDEDVHTAVENYLTEKFGDLGKKIHTARSRNDQVLTDLRLYTKEKLISIEESLLALAETLVAFAGRNKEVPIPGRTHMQLAMPSSVGLWAGAFAESLLDDLELLKSAYKLNDQCPLGSGASYGVALQIDRKMVSEMLGFAKVQNNVLYANNSRGKVESVVLAALSQVMLDLDKMASDLMLFSIPELGYFVLPDKFCTGSSMMPNKKNPDVLELARAKANKVFAAYYQVVGIIKGLPSGYNRDFQETKEPLMSGLAMTKASLEIMAAVVQNLKVDKDACIKACLPEIFATDKAVELVAKGVPFRDAYKAVAANLDKLRGEDAVANIKSKKHIGATGNLGLEQAMAKIAAEKKTVVKAKKSVEAVILKLLKL
jgi:argininosuccinate lyase